MGIGVVILFWAVVGSIFAAIGMLIRRSAANFLTRGVLKGRSAVVLAATVLPFACLAWGAAVFVLQWDINEKVFHRDPGIGDAWKCPLPNGYALLMIDLPDYGWVYNPRTQPMPDGVGEQEDAIFGVRTLQVANRYIALGVDNPSSRISVPTRRRLIPISCWTRAPERARASLASMNSEVRQLPLGSS